ncbi:separase isoform X1, partial [Tanacetum coccineum]
MAIQCRFFGILLLQLEDLIQMPSFSKCDFLWKVLNNVAYKSKAKHTNIRDSNAWYMVSTPRSCLEQLQELKDVKCLHPKISRRLETKISDILVEDKFSKQNQSFHTSMDFIARGKKSREQGIQGLDECIGYLNQAIDAMGDVTSKEEEDRGPTCYVLAQAYSLRALCREEKEQKSKEYVEDILSALKHWSSNDLCKFVEHTCMARNNFRLLDYVSDLLLLKVDIGDHRDIYELMIKIFKQINNLEESVAMLWQSRSTHVLCTSPLNVFVEIVSSDRKMTMEEWGECITNSNGIKAFSTDKLKQDASDMEKKALYSPELKFLAAQLFYDLGERLVADGLMSEALDYAIKACELRKSLYTENFEVSFTMRNGDVGADREVTSFHMHNLVAIKPWSTDHFEEFILTPYNILRCYLESLIQEGTILEILGDVTRAESVLKLGKNLSSFRGLTIFVACFSAAIGKIYGKRQLWTLAATELTHAKNQCGSVSCKKCKFLLEVIVYQEQGNLNRIKSIKEIKTIDYDKWVAKNRFENAEEILREELNVFWNVKETKGESARIGKGPGESTFNRIATSGYEVSDVSDCCWHIPPTGDLNSLKGVLQLQWERTCKRYLLRVLIGKGKCLVTCNDMKGAHKVLLESICLLVSMSKSCSSHSSISFSYFFEFIQENEIEGVHGSDIASLLYIIGWVSLKSSYDEGKRNQSSDKLFIPMPTLMSGLKIAFILSSEDQGLFRKIAQLLAILYVRFDLSACMSSTDAPSNAPSSCQWACFFHHATLGTNTTFMFYCRLIKVHGVSDSTSILHRLKPKKHMDLEKFVMKYLKDLPATTILGITILEDKYMTLLGNLIRPSTIKDSSTQSWLMVSRFNSKREPLVVLLPVNPILV